MLMRNIIVMLVLLYGGFLTVWPGFAGQRGRVPATSHINIISRDGKTNKVIYSSDRLFEAPNWSRDGRYLILNSEGKLWRLPITGGEPELIPTVIVTNINNDHDISPAGQLIAISAGHISVLPFSGGEPRRVTEKTPSYFHGWSPDGKWLAYCAQRNNNFDLYRISVSGGQEERLTSSAGYDDGPDYSPDGKWIYFNSDRSGSWDIWRIPADGAGENDAKAERVTSDEYEDWFPHPSPNGRWLVFLSFQKGTKGHPPNQGVLLRMMSVPGAKIKESKITVVTKLFGGQGTLNVNSWSPDSRQFAYVSYALRKPTEERNNQ